MPPLFRQAWDYNIYALDSCASFKYWRNLSACAELVVEITLKVHQHDIRCQGSKRKSVCTKKICILRKPLEICKTFSKPVKLSYWRRSISQPKGHLSADCMTQLPKTYALHSIPILAFDFSVPWSHLSRPRSLSIVNFDHDGCNGVGCMPLPLRQMRVCEWG